MLRSVIVRTLADQRRAMIGWAVGIAGYTAMVLAIYPSIHAKAADVSKMMQNYPAALKALFGVDNFTSPSGYLSAELLSFIAPLLLLLYAVSHASGATATEEDKGTIDVVLATPLSRSQLVLAKFVAVGVVVAGLGVVLFTTILAVAPLVDMTLSTARLAMAVGGVVLFALLAAGLALLFGCVTGHRGVARGLAAVLALAAYLLSSLAPLARWLQPWRVGSPFYHAIGRQPLLHGLAWGSTTALVVSIGVLVFAAAWAFERRDLSV